MPNPDIREDIKNEINSFRKTKDLLPLYIHSDECYSCKKHAEWMVDYDMFDIYPESDARYRLKGWTEINTAAFCEKPGSTHDEITKLIVEAIRTALRNKDNAQKVIDAKEYIAADISYPKQIITICIRLL